MPFTKALPEWNAPGTAPPQAKKDEGWLPIEKPPADWWNWFKHTTYQALKELQDNSYTKAEADSMAQGKVDTITTQKVNTLSANYKKVADSGEGYPIGLTVFWTDNLNTGWPTSAGMVFTVRLSLYRMMQYYYANQTNETWTRIWYNGSWSLWDKVETTAGAQAKVNASQVYKLTDDNGRMHQTIQNGDLNTIFTPGIHYIGSSSLTNAPVAVIGTLEVLAFSSTTVIQRYTTMVAGARSQEFIRYASSGSWGPWREMAPVDRVQMYKLTQDDGVTVSFSGDLDTLTAPGRYYAASITNGPYGLGSGFVVVDRLLATNGYFQEYTSASLRKFVRYFTNGAWSSWAEFANQNVSFANMTLQNGTTAVAGREPRYTKFGKLVTLEGEINNIAPGTTIGTLPGGFRPPATRNFKTAMAVGASNDGATIQVNSTGTVVVIAAANTTNSISLMGISFYVD